MKTTILEELHLPKPIQDALSREALRTRKPVNQIIRERLISLSSTVLKAESNTQDKQAA